MPTKLHEFIVPAGESLEFIANITTDELGPSNYLEMYLEINGDIFISAVDDSNEGPQSNGNPNDDNLSLSVLYKEKMDQDTLVILWAEARGTTINVPKHQLQIGYKTYGPGH